MVACQKGVRPNPLESPLGTPLTKVAPHISNEFGTPSADSTHHEGVLLLIGYRWGGANPTIILRTKNIFELMPQLPTTTFELLLLQI